MNKFKNIFYRVCSWTFSLYFAFDMVVRIYFSEYFLALCFLTPFILIFPPAENLLQNKLKLIASKKVKICISLLSYFFYLKIPFKPITPFFIISVVILFYLIYSLVKFLVLVFKKIKGAL